MLESFPSPPVSGFHLGPLFVRFYALGYIVGITLAVWIARRRWRAVGGNPEVVNDIAIWVVPAGIIGARIYFDVTTPMDVPHGWYGAFAVWSGGLGVWGGIAAAALVGTWRLRRLGLTAGAFANVVAPALLVAQAVGRIGNYFNKELFGKPTGLPWGLEIPPQYRPAGYMNATTFHPTFLYELIWDLALAVLLIWLGRRAVTRPWTLFALYTAGYSAFRIFEESLRIDSSAHFLGLRLNLYIAIIGTAGGLIWFVFAQRRPARTVIVSAPPAAVVGHGAAGSVGTEAASGPPVQDQRCLLERTRTRLRRPGTPSGRFTWPCTGRPGTAFRLCPGRGRRRRLTRRDRRGPPPDTS